MSKELKNSWALRKQMVKLEMEYSSKQNSQKKKKKRELQMAEKLRNIQNP